MQSRSWRSLTRLGSDALRSDFTGSGDPFLSQAFLGTLESSAVIGSGTAWEPRHLLFAKNDQPGALLPLYRKHDSRGEYVFDYAWADAYRRHGLDYYPKLVTAIPFTPVPGPRLLLAPGHSTSDWLPTAFEAVKEECRKQGASGWHGLFVEEDWLSPASDAGLVIREGCRFQWTNQGYQDFDDFLSRFTSKKRKDIRRERRRVAEQGITCRWLSGNNLDTAAWDFFYRCYAQTYLEHGQRPYLSRLFFEGLATGMADRISLVVAEDKDGPLASALFLHSSSTLYGRYWGALRRVDGLHFEVCYYQGIERCIAHGLTDFDPGTQGEHKLLRGFAPKQTHSVHWLREPGFQEAIHRFVDAERLEIRRYMRAAENALPFRQS